MLQDNALLWAQLLGDVPSLPGLWPASNGGGTLPIRPQAVSGNGAVYPVALGTIPHRLHITGIHPLNGTGAALVESRFPETDDDSTLTFFDTHYSHHRHRLTADMDADILLAGLAYALEVVQPTAVEITDPDLIRLLCPADEAENCGEPVLMSLAGAAVLHPRSDLGLGYHDLQAPVTKVESIPVLGRRFLRLSVTATRLFHSLDSQTDVSIDLYAAPHIWHGNQRPMAGADVRGVIWLQGRLCGDPA